MVNLFYFILFYLFFPFFVSFNTKGATLTSLSDIVICLQF